MPLPATQKPPLLRACLPYGVHHDARRDSARRKKGAMFKEETHARQNSTNLNSFPTYSLLTLNSSFAHTTAQALQAVRDFLAEGLNFFLGQGAFGVRKDFDLEGE